MEYAEYSFWRWRSSKLRHVYRQNLDSIHSSPVNAKAKRKRGRRPAAPLTASGQAQRRIKALRRARHIGPRRAWSGDRDRLRYQHVLYIIELSYDPPPVDLRLPPLLGRQPAAAADDPAT